MKQTTIDEDTLKRRQLLFSVMTDMIVMGEQRRSIVLVGVPSKGNPETLECK